MMATMQPTTTGLRSGGSRFFASPPRTPRHNHARPASRLVSRKLAPGFFRSEPVPHARFGTTQAADERPACTIFSYQTTSGYTVDPNSTTLNAGNESVLWNERVLNGNVMDIHKSTDPKLNAIVKNFTQTLDGRASINEAIADTARGIKREGKFLWFKTETELRRENSIYGYVTKDNLVVMKGFLSGEYSPVGADASVRVPGMSMPRDAVPFVLHTHPNDWDTSRGDFTATGAGRGLYVLTFPVDRPGYMQAVSPNQGQAYEGKWP